MVSKDAPKPRRFRIWGICIIIFIILSVIIVIHVARSPSEPFISVRFVSTNTNWTDAISFEVTNKMSVSVNCWIETEVLRSGKWVSVTNSSGIRRFNYFLMAHSQRSDFSIIEPSVPARFHVWYQRELKPIEVSILKKLPWLKRHYRLNPRRSLATYEWHKSETDK